MTITEREPLASHTTLHLGGPAARYAEARSLEDVRAALEAAGSAGMPLRALGGGSNLLVPDDGMNAFVLKIGIGGIEFTEENERVLLYAGAGARWDDVVDAACARGFWGIENLAGIPGSAGGAVVQNIGAYGAELSESISYADILDAEGTAKRVFAADLAFGYRRSAFKEHHDWVITGVALTLHKDGAPRLSYADLARAREAGTPLSTPAEVAACVRGIRARKFPDPAREGTAGSFFKNPVLAAGEAEALLTRYPALPHFPQENGQVKVSLAWLLDHVLSLKGHAQGGARLFEAQPLVIAVAEGTRAEDVEALAQDVEARVKEAFGITLEREVETFAV